MRFTTKLVRLGLTATPLFLCTGAQAQKNSSDYWPMKVGSAWVLSAKIGPQTLVQNVVVTKVNRGKDGQICTLDYTANGRSIQTETYLKTPTALLRISAGPNGSFVANPAVPIVHYPLKSGAKWTWKGTSQVAGQSFNASSTFTASGPETVKTPAGTFRAMHVHSALKVTAQGRTQELPNDYWFAPGVGMVRQTMNLNGTAIDGVLTSYKLK